MSNPVRHAANELTTLIERNPDKFMRLIYLPLLIHVRERLAKFIGAETDELVLVPNASHGINTVLKNFEWQQGDILIDGAHNSNCPPMPAVTRFTSSYHNVQLYIKNNSIHLRHATTPPNF
jgi:selenocysteine lyase/cysteine desulfurase